MPRLIMRGETVRGSGEVEGEVIHVTHPDQIVDIQEGQVVFTQDLGGAYDTYPEVMGAVAIVCTGEVRTLSDDGEIPVVREAQPVSEEVKELLVEPEIPEDAPHHGEEHRHLMPPEGSRVRVDLDRGEIYLLEEE
ncbi:MAG: hypothetical protein ABGY09_05955 [Euryarchaeota archaeon]